MSPLYAAGGTLFPLVIPIDDTLDVRMGTGANGALACGSSSADYIDAVRVFDASAGTYASESTDAADEDTNDVTITDPFDTGDIIYFGQDARFGLLLIDIGTQGAGDNVAAETVWEYYNGSTWASLTTVVDDSAKLTATAGNRILSFAIPSDWASVAVDSVSKFWIRLRSTADDVYNTTNPVLDRVIAYPFTDTSWDGPLIPVTGTITQAYCRAVTNSGSNNDTIIQIGTPTGRGTITWTKGDPFDNVTGLSIPVTAGEVLGLHVIQEDGVTEFANGSITLYITQP